MSIHSASCWSARDSGLPTTCNAVVSISCAPSRPLSGSIAIGLRGPDPYFNPRPFLLTGRNYKHSIRRCEDFKPHHQPLQRFGALWVSILLQRPSTTHGRCRQTGMVRGGPGESLGRPTGAGA